jgi:hypothetical protein
MARSDTYVHPSPIVVGQSVGPLLNLDGRTPKNIYVPAGTEGAAVVVYQTNDPGKTALLTYDTDGNLIEMPFDGTVGRVIELHPAMLTGARFVQVGITNGSGVAVNQSGADAAIELKGVGL